MFCVMGFENLIQYVMQAAATSSLLGYWTYFAALTWIWQDQPFDRVQSFHFIDLDRPSWTFSQIYTGSFMYYTLVVLVFWAQPFTKQFCLRVCTFLVFASGFLFHPKETRNDLNALDHLVLPTFHFVVQVSIMF